jgi:hypothetical protein
MNYLRGFTDRRDVEGNGTLVAVKVIVKTRSLGYEERRADAFKIKSIGKTVLERALYKGYCLLRSVYVGH